MRCDKAFLDVSTDAKFIGRTKENTNSAFVHLVEKCLFLFGFFIIMNNRNFFFRNPLRDKLINNIPINRELVFFFFFLLWR